MMNSSIRRILPALLSALLLSSAWAGEGGRPTGAVEEQSGVALLRVPAALRNTATGIERAVTTVIPKIANAIQDAASGGGQHGPDAPDEPNDNPAL